MLTGFRCRLLSLVVCLKVTGCLFLYQMKVGLLLRIQVVLQVSVTFSPAFTASGGINTCRTGGYIMCRGTQCYVYTHFIIKIIKGPTCNRDADSRYSRATLPLFCFKAQAIFS